MARNKIDYGIDLGTTNSAISRMEKGEPVIVKTDTQADTMPSCIFFNKKKSIQVGLTAYNALKREKLKALKDSTSTETNAFIEFKRTMGTDKSYSCEVMGEQYNSEQLSSEILKTLKSFVADENVNSIIVTVPAKFTSNQKDATLRAANLAGFSQCELLQEPIAASMAYGLSSSIKDGNILVFDFGGGTFDAALVEVNEGIMKVIDTEGDNYLGGKNLDLAIVDKIIIPYLQREYSLEDYLANPNNKAALQSAMKFFAEETKIQMSFNETHNILSDLGDIPLEDDDGEELELDIDVSQDDMERTLGPIFQKSVDICKDLLKRNNIQAASLKSLLLVGGPTYSPILRKMLEQQLIAPDLSVDPMTVVSKGAALFAATIDRSDTVLEKQRDTTKIQLKLSYEATTVESEEFVAVKFLKEKTTGEIPDKLFVEFQYSDKSWSTGKTKLDGSGEIVEVKLKSDQPNSFSIVTYNEQGDLLQCEPSEFTIIQGGKIGNATLPYNIGIEIKSRDTGKVVFKSIKGLEKNQSTPATGTVNGLKTQKIIRPGSSDDSLKIAIYQGNYAANNTRAIHNEHIYDVLITGEHLPKLLPENSDVDFTLKVDKSERITASAYFPTLDFTHEVIVPNDTTQTEISASYLESEIKKTIQSHHLLVEDGMSEDPDALEKIGDELTEINAEFAEGKNDYDRKMGVLHRLRKVLKDIEGIQSQSEWPKIEEELKTVFYQLEETNERFQIEKARPIINQFKEQIPSIIKSKSVKQAQDVIDKMRQLDFAITDEGMGAQMEISLLTYFNEEFDILQWSDRNRARDLLNRGLEMAVQNPVKERLRTIITELYKLLPASDAKMISEGDGNELIG